MRKSIEIAVAAMFLFVWVIAPGEAQQKSSDLEAYADFSGRRVANCLRVTTPLESPILSPRDYHPDELVFVDSLDSYVPNPFTVRLTCVNKGNAKADSVSGTFLLPKDMEFDPPGQQETQFYNPMSMEKWNIGDPVPEINWTVRWTKRYRYNVRPRLVFKVAGRAPGGISLDTVTFLCDMSIPGLMPMFSTRHEMPDSLGLRADGLDVEPNPFPVRFTVMNISKQVGAIRQVVLYFPRSDGLSLNPASPNPVSFDPNLTLDKGEEETFEWYIDVANRITRRNVQIQMIAYDDEGNPLMCSDNLPIANLKTALAAWTANSAGVIRYISSTDSYEPEVFTYTGSIANTGGAVLHGIIAQVSWNDDSGLDLIELDPTTDTANPKRCTELQPGKSVDFVWGFRLKNRNTTVISQYVNFTLEIATDEHHWLAPIDSGGSFLEIEPCNLTGVGDPPVAEGCMLYPTHPNPFATNTMIRFAVPTVMPITLVVHDALGREVRRLRDGVISDAGTHSVGFQTGDLPPGLYFLLLRAGGSVLTRKMIIQR